VALVAFKEEKRLELWVRGAAPRASSHPAWTFVRDYPILAASGRAGPKLSEGDRQVPEGVYRVVAMNPFSKFHLSMMIDYPNAFDRRQASEDGRTCLGGEICIHGGAASIGCLAVGDEAVEELYHLVGEVGPENVLVLIAPNDIRQGRPEFRSPRSPPWVDELYRDLRRELAAFEPRPDPATD
jgi:murein L,D-transpeptidase YafK